MSTTKNTKTICVDFDGVIHNYDQGFKDGSIYGEPLPGAMSGLFKLVHAGYNVVICTTRLNPCFDEENRLIREPAIQIRNWLQKHGFIYGVHWHDLTNNKPKAIAYIDDRGVRFTNWVDTAKLFC